MGPASLAIRRTPSTRVVLQGLGSGRLHLLTSACAVMLEFIAVHSLFAVSPFPVDTRERRSLSQGAPPSLCSWTSTQASCPDRGSPGHLLELGIAALTLSGAPVMSGLTTTPGSIQIKVFQRPGRAMGLHQSMVQRLWRMPINTLGRTAGLLEGRRGRAATGLCTAETGLSTQGSSNSIKNSQGLQGLLSCRTQCFSFLLSSPPAHLPCALCQAPWIPSEWMGCCTGHDVLVDQMQFCHYHSKKTIPWRGAKHLG